MINNTSRIKAGYYPLKDQLANLMGLLESTKHALIYPLTTYFLANMIRKVTKMSQSFHAPHG